MHTKQTSPPKRPRITSGILSIGNSDRQSGIALVVVLWGLVLIAIIAASIAAGTRTDIQMAFNVSENAKARALAEAGVNRAALALLETQAENRWRADGTVYPYAFGGGKIRISIHDEGGKIDLNKGRDEHLRRLFVLVGLDQDASSALVDAIADFRDADDLTRLNGAEDRDYRAAGLSHEAKDAPFEAAEELRLVLGTTPEIYENVRPFVTVYSGRQQIDLTTAPPEVILSVPGVDEAEVEAYLKARAETDGAIPTSALPIPSAERQSFALSGGKVVTVQAEAHSQGGSVFVREAVLRILRQSDKAYEILEWRIGRRIPEVTEDSPDDGESRK